MEKLGKGVEKLQRANPWKSGGRQLFFRDLMGVARQKTWNFKPVDAQLQVMARRSDTWFNKTSRVRRRYEQQAMARASTKQQEISEGIEHLQAALRQHRSR
eukprot:6499956-Pyramimonas_sp.AAC.1